MLRKRRQPTNPLQNLILEKLPKVFPPKDEAGALHPLVVGFNRLRPDKQAFLIIVRGIGLGEEPSYKDVAQDYNIPIGSIGPTKARQCKRLAQFAVQAGWNPYGVEVTPIESSGDASTTIEPPHNALLYGEAS